jgi:phosphate starvation-inducible PhoH-like protein
MSRPSSSHELAFGIGPAGTGKTYLAVAVGVSMFLGGHVDRIILSRPAVEAGERLGFLPGDAKEKVDPYMQPLYDALNDFLPAKQVQKMIEEKVIEIAPLGVHARAHAGSRLHRAGRGAERHLHADEDVPHPPGRGVAHGGDRRPHPGRPAARRPLGPDRGREAARGVPKISFTRFTSRDVVRHPLVAAIIEAYDADARARERMEEPG